MFNLSLCLRANLISCYFFLFFFSILLFGSCYCLILKTYNTSNIPDSTDCAASKRKRKAQCGEEGKKKFYVTPHTHTERESERERTKLKMKDSNGTRGIFFSSSFNLYLLAKWFLVCVCVCMLICMYCVPNVYVGDMLVVPPFRSTCAVSTVSLLFVHVFNVCHSRDVCMCVYSACYQNTTTQDFHWPIMVETVFFYFSH